MTYNQQKLEIDAAMIVMALGYATSLLVLVGWLLTIIL